MTLPHRPEETESRGQPEPSPAPAPEQGIASESLVDLGGEARPTSEEAPPDASGPKHQSGERSEEPTEPREPLTPTRSRGPGWPEFLEEFPDSPLLTPIVEAFARGDYRSVRSLTEALPASTEPELRTLALGLVARTRPDPLTRLLFVLACALFVFVAVWSMLGHGH